MLLCETVSELQGLWSKWHFEFLYRVIPSLSTEEKKSPSLTPHRPCGVTTSHICPLPSSLEKKFQYGKIKESIFPDLWWQGLSISQEVSKRLISPSKAQLLLTVSFHSPTSIAGGPSRSAWPSCLAVARQGGGCNVGTILWVSSWGYVAC